MHPSINAHIHTYIGNVLGSPTPEVITDTPARGSHSSNSSQASTSSNAQPPESCGSDSNSNTLHVDDSKPTTSLQVRLGDGGTLKLKANHEHTVGQLRNGK